MNQILIVSKHSFIDLITNSSTELFICDTKKSIEEVVNILEEKWKLYCQLYDLDRCPLIEILFVKAAKKEDIELADEYCSYYYEHGKTKLGDILVIGSSDNSIPYPFQEFISDYFNAQRIHLG